MDFVTSNLAVGSRHIDADRCKRNNITHVLSVHEEPDDIPGIVCLHNPMRDEGQDMPAKYWNQSIGTAAVALANPTNSLYVHCSAGVNRGPANVYAILRGLFGLDAKHALTLLTGTRPQAGKGSILYGNTLIMLAELNVLVDLPPDSLNPHFRAYMKSIDQMFSGRK